MTAPPPNLTYHLDRDLLDLEEDLPASEDLMATLLLGRGEPNPRRLEQIRSMIDKLDGVDPMAAPPPQSSPYPPHLPVHSHLRMHTPTSHLLQQDREGGTRGGWMYPERQYGNGPGGMRQQQMEWGMRPSPQQMAAARQHQMLMSGNNSGGSGGGRSANNWAVDMERRRIMELRQMQLAKEKDMYSHGSPHTYGNSGLPHSSSASSSSSSKPNISLLPTAVVRQMHNSKTSHQVH